MLRSVGADPSLPLLSPHGFPRFTARYTVRQFSIRRNEAIAVHVTVRGAKALDLLERGLRVKEFELDRSNFSATGEQASGPWDPG